ncbi:N4-gp56 family major capsid protein [Aeromonas sp. s11]|uniref:N4-gp56 family major capsid protein n=1 Tax=Aeromonas sp. s11 TaxID=3138481 RepID=UPI0034A5C968
MPITTYGDISPRVGIIAEVKMLEHAEPILVLQKFGDPKPQPKNKGQTVKFCRPVPFAPATTPLTEGVTPASKKMAYQDVTVGMSQYGDWCEITDVIADTHEDPVLQDVQMLLGEQAGETFELLTWGVISGGTNVIYANGSARNGVNTAISLNKLRLAARSLKKQRAKKITKILAPSVNVATKPVEAAFVVVAHTDCDSDIRGLAGFKSVAEYGTRQPLCPEEIGSVEEFRFVLSPVLASLPDAGGAKGSMVSTGGTSADVYPMVVLAQNAFGIVPLKGNGGPGSIVPMILNPNTPRGGDPLGQRGSASWKSWFTAVRLNELWLTRIEVAVTAL